MLFITYRQSLGNPKLREMSAHLPSSEPAEFQLTVQVWRAPFEGMGLGRFSDNYAFSLNVARFGNSLRY